MDYNAHPADLRIPAKLMRDDVLAEEILDACWREIVKGIDDVDEYVELIHDIAGRSKTRFGKAERIAMFLLDARREQQASFGVVPPSKLDVAFSALRERGILAEQDFTCCGTCGLAEIGSDIEDFSAWPGYVFFHTQDTDRLVESGSTYINYGIFWAHHVTEDEFDAMSDAERDRYFNEKTVALMHEVVVPTLQDNGVTVEWDGSMDTRILLSDVNFYRPLP